MRIRHVMTGVIVTAGGLLLSACDWNELGGTAFNDQETLNESISEVRFDNDSGDIKISVGDKLEVRRTGEYREAKPGKTYRVDGDALVLEACPERGCWVGYEVTVPEGTTVSGHVDSARVELVEVAGVNVAVESGDVTVRDVGGDVNATAQSGHVELTGIGGSVVASAEAGDVTINLAAPQNVSASTQSGNIDVTVPSGNYQVTATAESGNVDNQLAGSGAGPTIELRAESGDVTLQAA